MAENPTRQLVVFKLAGEEYALPIEQVHEIIRFSEPRAVTSDDPAVRGVISLRGRILPVFDLATRLGAPSTEIGETTRVVVVESDDDMLGVIVDSVAAVMTVDCAAVAPAPGANPVAVEGVVRLDERLLVLLDARAVGGLEAPAAEALEDPANAA
ncbi:MAG TPA: chemotaxis protein CheW [Baekduia sp.]|nr:chemotaxis protein CheW [Baekduia sp.]